MCTLDSCWRARIRLGAPRTASIAMDAYGAFESSPARAASRPSTSFADLLDELRTLKTRMAEIEDQLLTLDSGVVPQVGHGPPCLCPGSSVLDAWQPMPQSRRPLIAPVSHAPLTRHMCRQCSVHAQHPLRTDQARPPGEPAPCPACNCICPPPVAVACCAAAQPQAMLHRCCSRALAAVSQAPNSRRAPSPRAAAAAWQPSAAAPPGHLQRRAMPWTPGCRGP